MLLSGFEQRASHSMKKLGRGSASLPSSSQEMGRIAEPLLSFFREWLSHCLESEGCG